MNQMDVELHPAFVWDCDDCGTENFERAVFIEFDTEEEEQLAREVCGIEPEEGFPVMAPGKVTCRQCNKEFNTDAEQIYGEDADDYKI